jgi:hypothetical protein
VITERFLEHGRALIIEMLGKDGLDICEEIDALPDEEERVQSYREILHLLSGGEEPKKPTEIYAQPPVSMETFMRDKFYMGKGEAVYPMVMEELIEMNSGKYVEIVLTGGIGCGKTYCALYTTAYQLYLLSCMREPHKTFGKDPSTEILFVFQSINTTLAKELDYKRFKDMIECSPYFMKYFPFKKDLESRLVFPRRIEVVPVSGQETAAIGQDVIGGIIDEVNYMAVTQRSKNSVDGGTYNQAIALYNSISRRRKTRFMSQGKLPGLLCIVSSKRYPGQFTDIKELEAKTDPTIYIYDKRVWDVKPSEFSGERFSVFIGDASRKPRIIESADPLHQTDPDMVHQIPVEFREDFERDIINALRELDGTSTLARFPFFTEIDKITASMGKVESFLEEEEVDFEHELLTIDPRKFYKPHLPRFTHVDLAISGDSAGVVIGCVTGFTKVKHGEHHEEMLPEIWIDAILEVKPPKNGEIKFFKIRELLYALKDLGMNMKWATFDSFQSKDSQQILAQRGFVTGMQSMDTTPVPYLITKGALYDGRVSMPRHAKLLVEVASLERDPATGKIDHPANSSKDVSDALAGVIYGLSMRREIYVQHGISLREIPQSIASAVQQSKTAIQDR